VSIHVALNHVTDYRYDRLVALSPHVVRLRPAPHSRTRILSYSMRIEPARHFINWQQDPQSNYLARLVFPDKAEELRIDVDLIAEMAVLNPFDFFLEPTAAEVPFAYSAEESSELAPYLAKADAGPRFAEYLDSISRAATPTADFLVDLNGRLARDVRYLIRLEPGVQTPEQTLELGSGSCRDSGCEIPGRSLRHERGFCRPACLVRGLLAGGWMDRARPHVRTARGRGPHSPGVHSRALRCGPGLGYGR
jgi:transglutaminase-like putative cysteine protease